MQDLAIYTPFLYCRLSQIPAKKSSEKNTQKLETPGKKSLEISPKKKRQTTAKPKSSSFFSDSDSKGNDLFGIPKK